MDVGVIGSSLAGGLKGRSLPAQVVDNRLLSNVYQTATLLCLSNTRHRKTQAIDIRNFEVKSAIRPEIYHKPLLLERSRSLTES